jgi:hypothetical protein
VIVGQQQSQVEQSGPEILFNEDRLTKPMFRRWYVSFVHSKHA